MPADGELKAHAVNSSHDFYQLLDLAPSAPQPEIRRAYRKTALKYHPDKVGDDRAALDKFHLLQVAYEVLSDAHVRVLYDNARRARHEKQDRDAAYEGKRKALKEELERRESAGVAGVKRKWEGAQPEEAFERELKRLAADGARRRKEREEMLRKEARGEQEAAAERGRVAEGERERAPEATSTATPPAQADDRSPHSDMDRAVKLRWNAELHVNPSDLEARFRRFGKIQDVVINSKPKKWKAEGEPHKKHVVTGMIVFENMVAASMAVRDGARLSEQDADRRDWGQFEGIGWAAGKEPDGIPKHPSSTPSATSKEKAAYNRWLFTDGLAEKATPPLKGKPSFGSFKKKKSE